MAASKPVVWFAALIAACLVAAGHEVLFRQVDAHVRAGFGAWPALAGAAAALSTALVTARFRGDSRRALPWLLAVTAFVVTCSGPAWFLAFSRGARLHLEALGLAALVGGCAGATAASAWHSLADPLAMLGAVELALRPFRLLAIALVLGVAATSAALIGPWRSAAAIGMALAVAAVWSASVFAYLDGAPLPGAGRGRLAGIAALLLSCATFAAAEMVLPVAEIASYEGDLVHLRDTGRRRWAVTSAQGEFFLYADRMLVTSTLDSHRYYEMLVHPALAAAPRRERVLLLGTGHGLAEREVLRHPDVRKLVLVTMDGAARKLARDLPFLAEGSPMDDPRLTVVEQEPIVWLERAAEAFDVVIVDLPDPSSYLEGKSYTRLFYAMLAKRLTTAGVGVVQATSAFATPKSFGTIEATLRAAGLRTQAYHAPVPTLGAWAFVLFSGGDPPAPTRRLPAGLRFLTPEGLRAAFARASDVTPPPGMPPSLLHEQRVVALLEQERSR